VTAVVLRENWLWAIGVATAAMDAVARAEALSAEEALQHRRLLVSERAWLDTFPWSTLRQEFSERPCGAFTDAVTREVLPQPIRRYVERAVLDPEGRPGLLRFAQSGEMQLRPGRWLPFEAQQEARVDRIEFMWRARFSFAPLVSVRVRDWYRDGQGGLEGRLFGLIPIVRAAGPETARSEAMRYLAELPWFPHAILHNRDLEWHEIEPNSVEVATRGGDLEAAVTLHFDGAGDIAGASASNRPRQEGKRFVERPWVGAFGDYNELGGVRVPTWAEVSWELPEGLFTYFRAKVTGLELFKG
jgi:hypothetical protein